MGAEREGARRGSGEVEGVASERPGTPEYSQQAGRIRQAEDWGVQVEMRWWWWWGSGGGGAFSVAPVRDC